MTSNDQLIKINPDNIKLDEYGNFEMTEITSNNLLNEISGGRQKNFICNADMTRDNANFICW